MMRKRLVRPSNVTATAIAGLAFAATGALADEMPQVVISASAPPVHVEQTGALPGGTPVDLLSVSYHVHLAGLDLTKRADIEKMQQEIKVAAKKACDTIKQQYPQVMTDERTCIRDAESRGMAQGDKLVAAAEKNAKK